jgi:hypothetical protein
VSLNSPPRAFISAKVVLQRQKLDRVIFFARTGSTWAKQLPDRNSKERVKSGNLIVSGFGE